ncbi:acyltransferase family protein [Nocardioides oleivorans]|uniref:acyltransferase family protein n=1 Tax=Nocardioides oleivorans TaxID=273676 RepID=UPI0013EAC9A4|nr:acyltransferase [Nocardioides oleivorans]
MTLGEALARRDNALNFIRLVLAAGVIVGHSYQLADIAAPTMWLNPRLQEWALNGFFAVSGYLIAGSRVRLSFREFLERRARRILPGLWTVLVVVAFGFAPIISWLAGEGWDPVSSLTYVLRNLGVVVGQEFIDQTLTHAPGTPLWNGPLWTLSFEIGCYLAFGLFLGLRWVRRHGALVCAALLVGLMTAHPFLMEEPEIGLVWKNIVRLTSFFAAGVLCWFLRDRLPSRWSVVVACTVCLGVLSAVSDGQWYGQVFAAVALLTAGGLLPIRVGATNDISYGVYIYGWPVQQALADLGAAGLGIYAYQALSLLLVIPFAWASWVLVERRWLSRRRDALSVDVPQVAHHVSARAT